MELPKRRIRDIADNKINETDFTKLIEMVEKVEQKGIVSHLIYIQDFDLLKDNFDIFKRILKTKNSWTVISSDYEVLKYIENTLDEENCDIELGLVDDFEQKDRSYINVDDFNKCKIMIPLSYAMWNIGGVKDINITHYFYFTNKAPDAPLEFKSISRDRLAKIQSIVEGLSVCKDCNDIEKVIFVSNYLQNLVQFVDDKNITEASDGIYYTDSKDVVVNRNVHSAETVLFQNFGVCEGIAPATVLLMNNPSINVNVRVDRGIGHVWNIVKIDGKNYLLDNTWSISRNKDRYEESLKARSFDGTYLFFGLDTAKKVGHHDSYSLREEIENEDFSEEEKEKSIQKMKSKFGNFSNYNKPLFKSRRELSN